MPSYRTLITLALIHYLCLTPAYAKDKAITPEPGLQAEPQQAHDFLAYLVKLGIVDTNIKTKCHDAAFIPGSTVYLPEACISTLRVSYSCNEGKDTYTSETRIDWQYVSEIVLSGYNRDGNEIEVSGNISTSQAKGLLIEKSVAKKANTTRKTKLTFDSPVTAKRALSAFKLLKNKCDTSTDYPF